MCKYCATSGAHHVQHAMCHAVRRDSSANKFDRVEIAIILAIFYWLTRLDNEEREENGVSGENP